VSCFTLTHITVFASDKHSIVTGDLSLTNNILYLDIAYAGTRLVSVGERGLIVYSDDAGNHWQRASVPSQVLLTAVFFIDANTGWAVGHDGIILRTDDAALTWQAQHTVAGEEEPLFDVWFQDKNHGIAVGAYGMYLATDDGGKRWRSRKLIPDDYHLYAIMGGAPGNWFIAGENGTLLRSEDHGLNWHLINTPVQSSFFGMLSLSQNNLLLYGLRGTVLQSLDNGSTWQHVVTPAQVSLQGGARLNERQAVIVGLGGTLITTTDAGNTFYKMPDAGVEAISQVITVAPQQIIIIGAFGIRRVVLTDASETR
jgi:photosystem II stability/assembly factor-like uncharacterized protein